MVSVDHITLSIRTIFVHCTVLFTNFRRRNKFHRDQTTIFYTFYRDKTAIFRTFTAIFRIFTATIPRYFVFLPRHYHDISYFYRDTTAIFCIFACRGAAIFCLFYRDKFLPLVVLQPGLMGSAVVTLA